VQILAWQWSHLSKPWAQLQPGAMQQVGSLGSLMRHATDLLDCDPCAQVPSAYFPHADSFTYESIAMFNWGNSSKSSSVLLPQPLPLQRLPLLWPHQLWLLPLLLLPLLLPGPSWAAFLHVPVFKQWPPLQPCAHNVTMYGPRKHGGQLMQSDTRQVCAMCKVT
jgi:hypothetical protein